MGYKPALKSIRLKCLDCATTSDSAKNCEFTECSLYPLRFGKNVARGTSRLKAIRKKCIWCMNDMRKEIALCTSLSCILYQFRFGKRSRQDKIGSKNAVEFERRVAGA
jgi:hypothetical protein